MRKPLRLREAISGFLWCHQESNRGHKDFQSFALPTELWHQILFCGCKGRESLSNYQIFYKEKSLVIFKLFIANDLCFIIFLLAGSNLVLLTQILDCRE